MDVGDRRIGVAASDPTGTLASPLITIERTDEASDIDSVQRLVSEHEIAEIVVGMPFSLSGRRGVQ
ncbi:MAG: Holliday junction resolvase RuvX, partial [Chloroflexi bacterium]|nr:Holliday junction resolvase RuvX [Chloroflexota bacterium]